jgi:S-adenosyl-L-methionine hydrolase (adenosine-forming)
VPRPIIALVTDFGLRDHYVGSMKGAILGICPEAAVVDITHEIPAHDVAAGASALVAACADFPQGTIFVAVVDPGVGSTRRGLAAEAGGYFFVAPDNGILSGVLAKLAPARVVELASDAYARAEISRTFEGRDRFGPAAAWLAAGVALEKFGPPVAQSALVQLATPTPTASASEIGGEVVRVDRFGNLITNVDRHAFDTVSMTRRMAVRIGDRTVPVVATYADVPHGTLCSVFGSTNHLEIAANRASAASLLGLGAGARVVISPARD